MKKILLVLAAMIMLPGIALASDVSEAMFRGTVYVTNNSTTATDVSVNFTFNTQHLIENSYLNSSANDCAIRTGVGTDIAFMPSPNSTYPWSMFVSYITDHELLTHLLYTGNVTGGKIRYFPGPGGMTTLDDTSLELSDNFTIEQKGWTNTDNGTDKLLVGKGNVFRTYVSDTVSGNITSSIGEWGAWTSPTGNDAAPSWSNPDEAYDENTNSDAIEDDIGAGTWSDVLSLTFPATDISGCRIWQFSPEFDTVNITAYYDSAWHDVFLGAMAQGDWVTYEFWAEGVSKLGFTWRNDSADPLADVRFMECDYRLGSYTSVTATGVSSGEKTVKVDTYGIISGSVALDGTGDQLYAGSDASLQVDGDNFTVEMWVYFDDIAAHKGLFEQHAAGANRMYAYWSQTQHKVFWRAFDAVPAMVVDYNFAWTPTVDTWYLLHFEHLDNDWNVYVNTGTLGGLADADDVGAGSDNTTFGISSGSFFKGQFDEIRWYDRALDAGEKTANYNAGAGNKTPYSQTDLEGWWHLDEGSGTSSADETANSNDITLIADAGWTTGHVKSQFSIYIDGVEQNGTRATAIPDNSANWTYYENMGAYWEYTDISVNGTQVQYIDWEYGATFSDTSGYGNDATPTFRTTSSDADVSAELVAWEAVSPAEADPTSIETTADLIASAPTAPTQMYEDMNVSHLPLADDLINPLLADAEIPQAMFWLPLAFGTAILAGFGVYAWTKSLLAQVIVSMFVMGFWVATGGGVVPAWVFIPFVLEAVAIIMMKKTPAPW